MPVRPLTPVVPTLSATRALPLAAFALALAARVAVVVATPTPYAFDAFQRWAGREHLLVRDWLPATQAVVALVAGLGGDHGHARLALALVASLGVAGGAAAARRMGGPAAGWAFLPVGLFGPYLCWSAALYQEGTFLAALLVGLALALRARAGEGGWLPADLAIGLLGLVRYEGWPVVLLYLAWRRDPRALLAAWGALAWLLVRALHPAGYAPSPVDYADWGGLSERFQLNAWLGDLVTLAEQAWSSGGLALAVAGVVGGARALRRRAPGAGLVLALLLAQLAVVLGWLAGLETAIVRMQVVPGVLLGLLAAAGLGPLLTASRRRTVAAAVTGLLLSGLWLRDGMVQARRAAAAFRPERALLDAVAARGLPGPWLLSPRRGLGTRDRHDGCEIVEGISTLRHGLDFHCTTWPGPAPAAALQATWEPGGYHLSPPP